VSDTNQQRTLALAWAAIGLATLIATLDGTVNVAFPAITEYFRIAPAQIQWIISVFVLTQAALTIGFGWLADRFGHRVVFLSGLALSTVALSLCALATTYPALVGFRILQGLGAALIMACAPALASFLMPGAQRRRAMGYFTMWLGLGFFLGPLLGGWLVQSFDWPGAFLIRVPMALCALVLIWRLPIIGQSDDLVQTEPQKRNKLNLMRNTAFIRLQFASVMINLTTFTILLLTPFLFINWPGFSVVTVGLMLALYPLGILIAGLISARFSERVPSGSLLISGMFIAGSALCAAGGFGAITHTVAMAIALFTVGFGQGLFQSAHFDLTLAAVDAKDRGVAGSIGVVSRLLGFLLSAHLMMRLHQALQQHEPALPADYGQSLAIAGATLIVFCAYFAWRAR